MERKASIWKGLEAVADRRLWMDRMCKGIHLTDRLTVNLIRLA